MASIERDYLAYSTSIYLLSSQSVQNSPKFLVTVKSYHTFVLSEGSNRTPTSALTKVYTVSITFVRLLTTRRQINVYRFYDNSQQWLSTDACGSNQYGVIHISQIRF